MNIYFNGIHPCASYYRMGVRSNNLADSIEFILDVQHGDLDLSELKPFVKISTQDLSFIDKDGNLEKTPDNDKLHLRYKLLREITKFKSLDMQLQFERYDEADVVVWQTAVFNVTFNRTIDSDGEIAARNPEILQDHERRITELEGAYESVKEYPDKNHFPAVGRQHTIYIDASVNKCYRFDEDTCTYRIVGSDYLDITIINGNGGTPWQTKS